MKDKNSLISNLPLEKGIMGRDEYYNSAVLIPFVKIEEEYHILFQKRAANIRQGTEICFPGGGFDHEHDEIIGILL